MNYFNFKLPVVKRQKKLADLQIQGLKNCLECGISDNKVFLIQQNCKKRFCIGLAN